MNIKDIYIAVSWPETQELLEDPEFSYNSTLINDGALYDTYGPASYIVNAQWLIKKNDRYKESIYKLLDVDKSTIK